MNGLALGCDRCGDPVGPSQPFCTFCQRDGWVPLRDLYPVLEHLEDFGVVRLEDVGQARLVLAQLKPRDEYVVENYPGGSATMQRPVRIRHQFRPATKGWVPLPHPIRDLTAGWTP